MLPSFPHSLSRRSVAKAAAAATAATAKKGTPAQRVAMRPVTRRAATAASPGGRGGDGGAGTNGEDAGNGGHIMLRVGESDEYLLSAVNSLLHPSGLTSGAPGGAAGKTRPRGRRRPGWPRRKRLLLDDAEGDEEHGVRSTTGTPAVGAVRAALPAARHITRYTAGTTRRRAASASPSPARAASFRMGASRSSAAGIISMSPLQPSRRAPARMSTASSSLASCAT